MQTKIIMNKTYDLIIIGAGVIGTTIAWMARNKHPNWSIALVDKSLIGQGASSYSACIDMPFGHTELRRLLTRKSRIWYSKLCQEIEENQFREVPFVSFIKESKVDKLLSYFVDDRTRRATFKERNNILNNHPLKLQNDASLLCGTIAFYDTDNQWSKILANRFNSTPKSDVWEGTEISAIRKNRSIFELEVDKENIFLSERIIQATGPWLPFGPEKEEVKAAGIKTKKIIACHIDLQPKKEDPLYYFFDDEAFLLPQYEKKQWLFSFRCDEWDVYPDINQLKISNESKSIAKTILNKYLPSFTEHLKGGRVFCDAYGINDNPLIYKVQNSKNHIMVGAGSGSGYRLAPGIAEEALNLLSSKEET